MSNGFFAQNIQKRSKTEKVNITIGFYIFEIAYNYTQNIWDKL